MQEDYYVLERSGPSSYPLLEWDQSGSLFRKGTAVAVTAPIRLRLGAPVPRSPVMVDHHSLPEPVVSARIRDVLEPLGLYGVQLVPADVKIDDGDSRRFWLLHVYCRLKCMDMKKSVCRFYPSGSVLSIEKLVLDERTLEEIPLERRLLFVLAESTSVYICHRSIVDTVLAVAPQGLRFVPVEQWNEGAGFQG